MDLVKTAVQECKKNGMKVWIETDCGYPDGFAGGLISKNYPQLGMQGIVSDAHCTVAAGQTLDIPLPVDTLGILAAPRPEAPRRRRTPPLQRIWLRQTPPRPPARQRPCPRTASSNTRFPGAAAER